MNRRAAQLLTDLQDAGVLTGAPQFVKPVQGRYIRLGVVKATDETEKMEIAGMSCGVTREENGEARIYVFSENKGAIGPYVIASDDVINS